MYKFVSVLALSLGSLVSVQAQASFTGTLRYDVSWSGEGMEQAAAMLPNAYSITVGTQKVKTVTEGGMMAGMIGDIIADGKTRQTYFVNHTTQTVHVVSTDSLEAPDPQAANEPKPAKTKEKAVILGKKCVKYTATSTNDGTTIVRHFWITDELAIQTNPGSNGLASFTLDNIKGVVMKAEIVITAQGQVITMVMTASELTPAAVAEKEFDIPVAYKVKFGLPDMMRQ